MSFNAIVYKIFIASPGDVCEERAIVRDTIHQWNCNHSKDKGIILQPVGWETDSYPSTGASAQDIINYQCVNECDFCIGIFWTKLGTPTKNSKSGTVEEIELFIKSGKTAMIYFSTQNEPPDVDAKKLEELKNYKCNFENSHIGLYSHFSDRNDFQKQISSHIEMKINKEL